MSYRKSEAKIMELQALKEKIFDSAMTRIKQDGFDSLTIRDVCADVGISVGMFYKLYSCKLDLLSFYYERIEYMFDEFVNKELQGLPLNEKIIKFYVWLCNFTAGLGADFCKNFFDSKNPIMNTTNFTNKIINITNSFMKDNPSAHEVSKDLCVIIKGVIFDWSANDGNYDMAAFSERLLKRCLPGLIM